MISREKLRNDLIYCKGLRRKSLEAVIEVINKQPQIEKCADCSRRKWYTKGYQDGLNADKWIPCEERLPSEYDEYIVTYKEISNEKVKYYTSTAWFKPQTKRWYGNISIPNLEREVIAWQEKPTPYERMTEREGECSYEVQLPRSKQYICKKTGLNCTAEKLKFCKYKQPYKKEGAENE